MMPAKSGRELTPASGSLGSLFFLSKSSNSTAAGAANSAPAEKPMIPILFGSMFHSLAIRMVRAYAKEWNIDPNKIGIMGFSAGAELAAPAAVLFEDFDKKNSDPSDPLAGVSSRPDFAGIIYPGP